jgi:hypothetical protein
MILLNVGLSNGREEIRAGTPLKIGLSLLHKLSI